MRRRLAIAITICLFLCLCIAGFAGQHAWRGSSKATYLATFTWEDAGDLITEEAFGGFSALAVTDGGQRLIAISDTAHLVHAEIERENGRILSVTADQAADWIYSPAGSRLSGFKGDSEGIALHPEGGFYISYERITRVAFHKEPSANSVILPRPLAFEKLPRNNSLEALAIDAQCRLYTFPEDARDAEGNIPVYRWDGTEWSQPFALPKRGFFSVVSAEVGPDGRLYVLERRFRMIGFQSRLRRWDLTDNGVSNEKVLFKSWVGGHDNLEGLSVWRNAEGQLIATLISDDNFLSVQKTELVEYALPN